jgi:hypothetical protein
MRARSDSVRRRRFGKREPAEHALLLAAEEARLDKQAQMAGEARLGLAEDRHQLADVEGAACREGKDAQPRRFRRCPKGQEKVVHALK